MNEKLIKLLGLPKDATEEQIVAAVAALQQSDVSLKRRVDELEVEIVELNKDDSSALERAINKKIVESHGALNRQQALVALEAQATQDATAKKAQRALRK